MKIPTLNLSLVAIMAFSSLPGLRAQSVTLERLAHHIQTDGETTDPKPSPYSLEIHIRHGSTDVSQWGPMFYKPGTSATPTTGASPDTNTGTLNFSSAPNNGQDYEFIHRFSSLAALDAFYPIAPTDGGQYGVVFLGNDPPSPDTFTAGLIFSSEANATFANVVPQVADGDNGAAWSGGILRVKRTGVTTLTLNAFPQYSTTNYGSLIAAGVYRTSDGAPVAGASDESFYIPSLNVNQPATTEVKIDGSLLQAGQNYTLELQYGIFGSDPQEGFPDGVNFQGLAAYYQVTTATVRVIPTTVQNDFNGDGQSDILWRNTRTGDYAFWLMNGTVRTAGLNHGPISLDWQISGTGDFNADGKPDILWRNTVSGDYAFWLMDGTTLVSGQNKGPMPLEWQIAGTGDFNADGKTDIIWRNTVSGDYAFWLMDGTTLVSGQNKGPMPLEWQITGTDDFGGDGHTDIIWRNTQSGDYAFWLMDGTTMTSGLNKGAIPVEWQIEQ